MVVNPEDRFSHVGDVNRPIMYSFIKAIVISVIQFFFFAFFFRIIISKFQTL